jgi:hypothetical protein
MLGGPEHHNISVRYPSRLRASRLAKVLGGTAFAFFIEAVKGRTVSSGQQ